MSITELLFTLAVDCVDCVDCVECWVETRASILIDLRFSLFAWSLTEEKKQLEVCESVVILDDSGGPRLPIHNRELKWAVVSRRAGKQSRNAESGWMARVSRR